MIYITGDIHGEVFRVVEAVERFGITNEDMPNDKADALGEFYKVHGYTKLDLFALGCVDCCL